MLVVFDMDGVVIDSADLVRESYLEAGVFPPWNVLAFEGVSWVAEQVGTSSVARIKQRKNAAYLKRLAVPNSVRVLPGLRVARRLQDDYTYVTVLVTGAPEGTIDALRSWLEPWPFMDAIDGYNTRMKMMWLQGSAPDTPGIYIDDQTRYVDLPTEWRFIHYDGQTEDELMREVLECSSALER